MIFDIIFVCIFLILEVVYYISFRKHEEEVRNDLLAISERLELILEQLPHQEPPKPRYQHPFG